MIDPHLYFSYFLAALILVLAPGPSVMLAAAHGLSYGVQRSVATMLGVIVAIALHAVVTAAGLGALVLAMPEVLTVMRWLGAAYIAYLGLKLFFAPPAKAPAPVEGARAPACVVPPAKLFTQGFVVSVMNPKPLVFYVAFLPIFLSPAYPVAVQLMVFVATHLALAFFALWIYAAIGEGGGRVLGERGKQRVQRGLGVAMVGAAIFGLSVSSSRN